MNEERLRKAMGLEPLPKKRSSTSQDTSIKDTIDKVMKLARIIYKAYTKNHIPKSYDDVMAMKERLELEEKRLKEKDQAIITIKELQSRAKQRNLDIKKARRAKIKKFLHIEVRND